MIVGKQASVRVGFDNEICLELVWPSVTVYVRC
jgi:hypothetical protein